MSRLAITLGVASAIGLGGTAYHTARVDLPLALKSRIARELAISRDAVSFRSVSIGLHGIDIDGLAAGQMTASHVRAMPSLRMIFGGRATGTVVVDDVHVEDPPIERVDELHVAHAEIAADVDALRVVARGLVADVIVPGAEDTMAVRIGELGADVDRAHHRPRRIGFTSLAVGPVHDLAGGIFVRGDELELRSASTTTRLNARISHEDVDVALTLTREPVDSTPENALVRAFGIDSTHALVSGRIDVHVPRGERAGEAKLALTVDKGELSIPRIAPAPLALAGAMIDGHVELRDDGISTTAIMSRGAATIAVTAQTRTDDDERRLVVEVTLPTVGCSELLQALPPTLRPALDGMGLDGEVGGTMTVSVPLDAPAHLSLDGDLANRCAITAEPPFADAAKLRTEAPIVPGAVDEDGRPRRLELGPANPSFRRLDAIPPALAATIVESEDGRFWRHRGVDLQQVRSALAHDVEVGAPGRGGSTITQQLAKNLFLSGERTLGRKLEEAVLAWRLEQDLGKRRILELYLNMVELGPGTYGVVEGAQRWFRKPLATLTPMEMVSLAALLPAPRRGMDAAFEKRRDQLIARMDPKLRP